MKDYQNMTYLEHLEDLRWHLIRSIISILLFSIIAFYFKNIVFDSIIFAPKNPSFITNRYFCLLGKYIHTGALCINQNPMKIININMSGQFSIHVMVSAIMGCIVAFPYLLWELWRFIKPALYPTERRYTRRAIFYILILFLIGVVFGYFIILPISIEFFATYVVSNDVPNQIVLDSYISTTATTVLASGLVFELPLLIYVLTHLGLFSSRFLKKYRRHAIVVILTIAAIITPPDVFSQLMVSFPLLFLYEFSIWIAKRIERRKTTL